MNLQHLLPPVATPDDTVGGTSDANAQRWADGWNACRAWILDRLKEELSPPQEAPRG